MEIQVSVCVGALPRSSDSFSLVNTEWTLNESDKGSGYAFFGAMRGRLSRKSFSIVRRGGNEKGEEDSGAW